MFKAFFIKIVNFTTKKTRSYQDKNIFTKLKLALHGCTNTKSCEPCILKLNNELYFVKTSTIIEFVLAHNSIKLLFFHFYMLTTM